MIQKSEIFNITLNFDNFLFLSNVEKKNIICFPQSHKPVKNTEVLTVTSTERKKNLQESLGRRNSKDFLVK